MTYVVAEPCVKCKYTDCVVACPVDCFHEGANMLVIDPVDCIDCRACVDHCPVNAIFSQDELPSKWADYRKLNAEFSKKWPVIDRPKPPLETAEAFKDLRDKPGLIDPAAGPGTE